MKVRYEIKKNPKTKDEVNQTLILEIKGLLPVPFGGVSP